MANAATLQQALLDLMIDGQTSFAALYSAINRLWPGKGPPLRERLDVEVVWDALCSMERSGWVKAKLMTPKSEWADMNDELRTDAKLRYLGTLPHATYEDMALDEVGVWFQIQPAGRAEWERLATVNDASEKWMLDQDSSTATIIVCANNVHQADKVIADWLSHHLDIEIIPESRIVQPSAGFRLHDNTYIEGGIRLRVAYRMTLQTTLNRPE